MSARSRAKSSPLPGVTAALAILAAAAAMTWAAHVERRLTEIDATMKDRADHLAALIETPSCTTRHAVCGLPRRERE